MNLILKILRVLLIVALIVFLTGILFNDKLDILQSSILAIFAIFCFVVVFNKINDTLKERKLTDNILKNIYFGEADYLTDDLYSIHTREEAKTYANMSWFETEVFNIHNTWYFIPTDRIEEYNKWITSKSTRGMFG